MDPPLSNNVNKNRISILDKDDSCHSNFDFMHENEMSTNNSTRTTEMTTFATKPLVPVSIVADPITSQSSVPSSSSSSSVSSTSARTPSMSPIIVIQQPFQSSSKIRTQSTQFNRTNNKNEYHLLRSRKGSIHTDSTTTTTTNASNPVPSAIATTTTAPLSQSLNSGSNLLGNSALSSHVHDELNSNHKSRHNSSAAIPFTLSPISSGRHSFGTDMVGKERVRQCCYYTSKCHRDIVKSTMVVMNFLARVLFWVSLVSLMIGVIWYSMELHKYGTDPHLIAWFSAGAFVILGFPISMFGIIMHLSNYYQPNVQCYVVRILWMVPIYSIESWLSLRFHKYAIYIETLRDCYESYVLYCFFQFLIEVLGGEETLIQLLKNKSPTRGVHYPPLDWCMKPWIMGQPNMVSTATTNPIQSTTTTTTSLAQSMTHGGFSMPNLHLLEQQQERQDHQEEDSMLLPLHYTPSVNNTNQLRTNNTKVNRIQWTSPFFVHCKLGVLQYVLLKFISALFVVVLEQFGLYKEGDFTPQGGYLYICILTNTSQCWALYCLVFFYYATKNELSPIRPVGKFLSVKALVFFTWWQSVGISILFYFGLITPYKNGEWSAEAVAKGIQDYLICVELFFFAIAHIFVFPHTDYLQPLGTDSRRVSGTYIEHKKRLGRRKKFRLVSSRDDKSVYSKSSSIDGDTMDAFVGTSEVDDTIMDSNRLSQVDESSREGMEGSNEIEIKQYRDGKRPWPIDEIIVTGENSPKKTGFVRAFLDSAVPRDVMDNTVGLARGDFNVEKKTLLSHAAASDEYKLFATKMRTFGRKR